MILLRLGACILVLSLSGCFQTQVIAPVEERRTGATSTTRPATTARPSRKIGDDRPESYVVQKGDTLFAIALDFGFDYRELAGWNNIADPSRIQAGQRLRLSPPLQVATAPTTPTPPATAGAGNTESAPAAGTATEATPDVPAEVKPVTTKEEVSTESLPAPTVPSPATSSDTTTPGAAPTVTSPTAESAPVTPQAPTLTEPKALVTAYTDKAWSQISGIPERAIAVAKPESDFPPATPEKKNANKETAAKPAPRPVTPSNPAPASSSPSAAVATPNAPIPPLVTPSATPTPLGDDRVEWMWPARGELVYRFGDNGRLKGVGIGGKAGQPVVAAAPGRVVYSGSGLRGYGKLVIIKHNDAFLSVYAHNRDIVVREGDQVRRGQKIAEMGNTGATNAGVHFEIRRFGKPLDPLSQLPG